MNRTVISGTARTNSMKTMQSVLMIGSFEWRPSARRMPSGSETTMPTTEMISVTSRPPQCSVGTTGSPNSAPPTSRMKATIGKTTKKKIAPMRLERRVRPQQPRTPIAASAKTMLTRQCSAIG